MIRIAIIGFGKIARDEHLPAIAANPAFTLTAVVTPSGDPSIGVPWFASHQAMLAEMADAVDAVAICTPPAIRHAIARDLVAAGLDALLEKPPAATLGAIEQLEALATANGRVLFAAWHSQHAPAVPAARQALAGTTVTTLEICWREDFEKFHPGQQWMWAPGGFGVFDTGINALSIASKILPMKLIVRSARLLVPENRHAPVAARIDFGAGLSADFDWRYEAGEEWAIRVGTAEGRRIALCDGGGRLIVDHRPQVAEPRNEYGGIYARFAELVGGRRSEVDSEPLRIVADAFLVGHYERTAAFVEEPI